MHHFSEDQSVARARRLARLTGPAPGETIPIDHPAAPQPLGHDETLGDRGEELDLDGSPDTPFLLFQSEGDRVPGGGLQVDDQPGGCEHGWQPRGGAADPVDRTDQHALFARHSGPGVRTSGRIPGTVPRLVLDPNGLAIDNHYRLRRSSRENSVEAGEMKSVAHFRRSRKTRCSSGGRVRPTRATESEPPLWTSRYGCSFSRGQTSKGDPEDPRGDPRRRLHRVRGVCGSLPGRLYLQGPRGGTPELADVLRHRSGPLHRVQALRLRSARGTRSTWSIRSTSPSTWR